MAERTIATAFIWVASIVGISKLLDSVGIGTSGFWQICIVALIALIICAAAGSTIAMWVTANNSRQANHAALESDNRSKQKRSDPQREARVRRLLDTLDDEDIEALEHFDYSEDGERTSVEALLRRR